MRTRNRFLTTSISLVLLLTACGDDEDTATEATSAPTSAAAATTRATTTAATGTTAAAETTSAAPTTRVTVPAEADRVDLACAPGITGMPMEYVRRNDIDASYGLEIECVQVQSGPQLSAAMLAGEIDISGFNPANIFPLLEEGVGMVGFQPILDAEYFDLIVRKDFPLPSAGEGWEGVMRDLQGARIGVVARGAAAEDIARGLFTEAGLNPDDAVYIATGLPNTTLPTMANGEIDAALVFEPGVTLALAQGIAVQPFSIAEGTGPERMDWGSLFYGATREYAEENAAVLARFQQAYQEGRAWATDPANRDEVIAFTAEYLALEPAVAEQLVDRNLPFFSGASTLEPARYDAVGDFFAEIGKTSKPYYVADYAIDVSG